jgi:hypothetical protein
MYESPSPPPINSQIFEGAIAIKRFREVEEER